MSASERSGEQPPRETKIAEVCQTGYRCHHATRSMTVAELKAGGYTHVRVVGYLDVDDLCPACKATRAAARSARKAGRR